MGIELVMKAIALIKNRSEKEKKGTVVCPKCSRNLNYSIAAGKGHIWAQCETNLCLAFVQ